jgi:N-acetylglucosaminyl-diphospho-decaprenol L-rhamnosyltransferase
MSWVGTDVVVVAYRSAAHLRACVAPLCDEPDITVTVVDNACPEGSVETVRDLPVRVVEMGRNAGFAAGCNAGAAVGSSGAVLFLNPDAQISAEHVRLLAQVLERDPKCAAVGPRIVFQASGETQRSVRRTPTLVSAFAEAFFLHHLFTRSDWATEEMRQGYDRPHEDAPWLIGAALCVRREAFERIGGWDERYFMYNEDTDLGLRLRKQGWLLRYESAATAIHAGRASSPRSTQVVMRAESRLAYARAHERGLRYAAFRLAYVIYELLRIPLAATRSRRLARARLAALGISLGPPRRAVRP